MKKLLFTIFISLSLLPLATFSQYGKGKFIVSGKIVDSNGKAVKNGFICQGGDHQIYMSESKSDGTFELNYDQQVSEISFRVSNKPDHNEWLSPFGICTELPPEYYQKIKTLKFEVDSQSNKFDIGAVSLQIYYGKVQFLLNKKDLAKILDSEDGFEIRVRDKQGNIIGETSSSTSDKETIRKNSALKITLPYGVYSLEIKSSNFGWQILTDEINISDSKVKIFTFSSKETTIFDSPKFQKLLKLSKESALKELKKRNLEYNINEYKKNLESGNIEAIILFLKAGMSPNTRFNHGFFPLITANNYPEIIQLLITAGANVNLQTDNIKYKPILDDNQEPSWLSEETALMIAASSDNLETLRLLLQNGALPDIKNSYNETALIEAIRRSNEEMIVELLKFGANPNVANRDGKTAIEMARENQFREIINLIEKALENQK